MNYYTKQILENLAAGRAYDQGIISWANADIAYRQCVRDELVRDGKITQRGLDALAEQVASEMRYRRINGEDVPFPLYYLSLLPAIRTAAQQCGYAVGLHGSMRWDLDLIAVPWIEDALEARSLVEAICRSVSGVIEPRSDGGEWPRIKPHGRLFWAIHLGAGAYINLSVMPAVFKGESA